VGLVVGAGAGLRGGSGKALETCEGKTLRAAWPLTGAPTGTGSEGVATTGGAVEAAASDVPGAAAKIQTKETVMPSARVRKTAGRLASLPRRALHGFTGHDGTPRPAGMCHGSVSAGWLQACGGPHGLVRGVTECPLRLPPGW